MRKIFILAIFAVAVLVSSYSFKSKAVVSDPNPPTTNTGAPANSRTCVRCHGDFALNLPGGSVIATGLPAGSYAPGQVYDFSVTISNAASTQMWGFAIKAVIAGTGTALGTFSTTNANTNVSAGELRNTNGASFTGTSYTYNNLRWTAPASGSSPVSFYVAAVAADGDNSEAGDYVYSNVYLNIVLPVTLGEIKGKLNGDEAVLEWNTYSEFGNNYFEVQRSIDGRSYQSLTTITGSGISNSTRNYRWIDTDLPKNEEILYYRLKITDDNGKTEYSKVITLKQGIKTYVQNMYPTVTRQDGTVKMQMMSHLLQPAEISIYSSNGQKISVQLQKLIKGENEFTIRSNSLTKPGVYLIKIKAGSFSETKKLVVQ
jgi:Secretion system C-terminal sorting domain